MTNFDQQIIQKNDVSALASAALRYLKVMNTDHAINIITRSKLLKKISKTSSNYSNRNMHNKNVRHQRDGSKISHNDPKILKAGSENLTLGPFVLCRFTQQEYISLYFAEEWPALAIFISSINHTPTDEGSVENELNRNGQKCFDYDFRYRLCGNKAGPKDHLSGSTSIEEGGDNTKSRTSTSHSFNPKVTWKYVAPVDLNQKVVAKVSIWNFCLECIFPVRKHKGCYNLSHNTKDHRNFNPGLASPDTNHSVTPVVNSLTTPAAKLA